jgi:TP901 family phage tail tape measure protein
VGAGVDINTIKALAPDIAKLSAVFPEINMEQFGVAIVGVFNVFREQIKGATDDAGKFKIIIEQLLKAQAEGVIRPESFTKVMQYMGEMSHIAGFTTEQMFALATAVSDTGIKASNASRYISGMMEQFSKSSVQYQLSRIGIQIDKNKTLAEQFDDIMGKLKQKLGEGGEAKMGVLTFLDTIMSSERKRGLLALLDQWDRYLSLQEKIKNSGGGLDAAYQTKLDTINGQWQILKNTLTEIASGSSITSGYLKEIVTGILDMARGFLYAIEPSRATGEN